MLHLGRTGQLHKSGTFQNGIPGDTAPGVPSIANAKAATTSSLTCTVTLSSAGLIPTLLAWQYSEDNATWTQGADITLVSPSLGKVFDQVFSPLPKSNTLYYIQIAEKA